MEEQETKRTGRPLAENPKRRYTITLDKAVKEEAMRILTARGFTFSGAIELFLRTVINDKGFQFNFGVADMSSRVEYERVELPPAKGTEKESKGE